jgi:RimJ/RimL family protein N-acetyltransferase
VLREAEAGDRSVIIELFSSQEVGTHIGGARPRNELELSVPDIPGRRAGFFVVERDDAVLGIITLDRRSPERRGRVLPDKPAIEIGYMFLPHAWGLGYATEACAAALRWSAHNLPGEPVVVCAQIANQASVRVAIKLGFTEVDRFEEYGAEQWFGVWSPNT